MVSEGVRDDFKTMSDIYGRLCTYLDLAATNPSPLPRGPREEASRATSTVSAASEETATRDQPSAFASYAVSATGAVTISTGTASDFVPPPLPPAVDISATLGAAAAAAAVPPDPVVVPGTTTPATVNSSGEGALSTFIATQHSSSSSPPAALPMASSGVGEECGTAEELKVLEEGVMNDLDVSERLSVCLLSIYVIACCPIHVFVWKFGPAGVVVGTGKCTRRNENLYITAVLSPLPDPQDPQYTLPRYVFQYGPS